MLLLLDRYSQEYLEWQPDVLRLTLERDATALSNATWSKILAGRVALNSASPWKQWDAFHWTCLALNGVSPNFVYLENPEIGQLVVGVEILKMCDTARTTGEDVDKFVAAAFMEDGLPWAPPPLDFCERELEERKIECGKCGAIHRDDNDTTCVTCGSTDLHGVPYAFSAEKAECRALWSRSALPLAQAIEELPDTPAGSATYRLLIAWDYARDARRCLVHQLRAIRG